MSNFDLYLTSCVYIKSLLEHVDQTQSFKKQSVSPTKFRFLMIPKLIITVETELNGNMKGGSSLTTIQARRNLQRLAECGKWDVSTYNSNTIFYKALGAVYLIAILNKTSGHVPLCLKISPSTCLFKSLLLEKSQLEF